MVAKHGKSTLSTGLVLDISDVVLTTVRNAASVSTIPFFKEAADLALGILAIAQGATGNKEGFARLAEDACDLVYAIICIHRDESVLAPEVLDNLKELLGTLASIEKFSRKEASRGIFLRVIRYKSDVGRIQEYRESLRQSLDVFGLKSSMSIQENIARMMKQQDEVVSFIREARDAQRKEALAKEKEDEARAEMERLEEERLKTERQEKERLEQARLEEQRLAKERLEKYRLEREQLEKDRLEQQRLEKDQLEKELAEKRRLEREKAEAERTAQHQRLQLAHALEEDARREREKLEHQIEESRRREAERQAHERWEAAQREVERLNQEKLEKERLAALAESAFMHPTPGMPIFSPSPTSPSKNPFFQLQSQPQPQFPGFPGLPQLRSHSGAITVTSVNGDHITTDASQHTSSTNSGNTTVTNTTGSGNDSSVRVYGGSGPRRGRRR